MKKILIVCLCALLLAGCSSNKFASKVTDDSKVIISGKDFNVSKQDFYEYLLENYGANQVLNLVLSHISDKEINDTKAIDKLLKERLDLYDEYSDGGIEDYVKDMGYASVDEYKNKVLLPDVKQELLREKYITENYDSLMTDYKVCSLKKITLDKESTALEVIGKITDEKSFDDLMKTYGSDKAQNLGVVNKNSALDDNLVAKLADFNKLDKDGVYKEAVKTTDDKYAVIFVYDTDKTANKATYIESLASNSEIITKAEGYYLTKYNFTVNEEQTKEDIKDLSNEYIK